MASFELEMSSSAPLGGLARCRMSSSLWRRQGAECNSLFDGGAFAHKFHLKFLDRRQIKMVLYRKKVALVFVESVTDDRLIPIGAKNNSYRRIVAGIHHFTFVVMLVKLHLKQSGMIWSLKGAKTLLPLRTLHKSNRLDEFFSHLVKDLTQVDCAA